MIARASSPAAAHHTDAAAVAPLDIVIVGLSITSSWGNGHATTFRALVAALTARGHRVRFYERNVPWYASHRDLPNPPWGETVLYDSVEELQGHFPSGIDADLVILGSYVPEATRLAPWLQQEARGVVAFYDIDTPVTVAALDRGRCEYLLGAHIPSFDCYLSFAGGAVMERLHTQYGAPVIRPLYCSVDPQLYRPRPAHVPQLTLGYLGTYSDDRQPALESLLLDVARAMPTGRFAVAGAKYPPTVQWPHNVVHHEHCPPAEHPEFYTDQRFTLNITRADMVRNGWSPSVRLFEAAACGVPIISDWWEGLDEFFEPGSEIVVARDTADVLKALREIDETMRRAMAERARRRVLASHTAAHRAHEIETLVHELRGRGTTPVATMPAASDASGWSVPW
jgi:spore maturation protein CgeB